MTVRADCEAVLAADNEYAQASTRVRHLDATHEDELEFERAYAAAHDLNNAHAATLAQAALDMAEALRGLVAVTRWTDDALDPLTTAREALRRFEGEQ